MRFLIFSMLLTTFSFSSMALKLASVDIQKVLLEVKEGQRVKDRLKKDFDKKQASIKKEENEIRKMQEKFQKQSEVLSDKARQKQQMQIQEAIMKLQQKTAQYQSQMRNDENRFKKPIIEKIKKVIDAVAAKGGFDMIFEASTAPVYIKDYKDITDVVIKNYDNSFK